MTTTAEDRLLTVKQLAKKLGLDPQSIYRGVKVGLIPHVRIMRSTVRFDPATIEQWLRDNTVDASGKR